MAAATPDLYDTYLRARARELSQAYATPAASTVEQVAATALGTFHAHVDAKKPWSRTKVLAEIASLNEAE